MADGVTTILGLVKPETGASTDTWGPKINSNLDEIDALFTDPVKKLVPLEHGGSGSDTAAGARTNFGLGALATASTVGTAVIVDGAVTTGKIADGAVTAAKIPDSTITSAKIADGTIVTGDIADSAITSAKIADATIATGDIADSAITTAKIADSAITLAKLAAAVVALMTPTGTVTAYVGSSAPSGWLLLSGRTIGDASSGATARANADTATLYDLIWNAMTNSEIVIQTSAGANTTRGANSAADFAAHKRLPLPDLRGRVIAGQDDMDGTSANRIIGTISGLDGDVLGAAGGAEGHVLTVAQLASHAHNIQYDTNGVNGGGGSSPSYINQTSKNINTDSAGGDTAHNNVQPTLILNYIVKY